MRRRTCKAKGDRSILRRVIGPVPFFHSRGGARGWGVRTAPRNLDNCFDLQYHYKQVESKELLRCRFNTRVIPGLPTQTLGSPGPLPFAKSARRGFGSFFQSSGLPLCVLSGLWPCCGSGLVGTRVGGVLATLRRWISRSEGRIVVVDQPARRLVVNVGGRTTIGARLTNLTSRQVTVIGVESSCGCTAVEPIPLSVPACGTADLTCKFNMDGRPAGSEYHGELRLLVDQPSPEIRLTVDIDIR